MAERLAQSQDYHCTLTDRIVVVRWISIRWREPDGTPIASRARESCDGSPSCGQVLGGDRCPCCSSPSADGGIIARSRPPHAAR
jgi:hypothetical protein